MVYQKKCPNRKPYLHLTDLTPQQLDGLISDLKDGNYFQTCCRKQGIDKDTGERWRERGRAALHLFDKGETVPDKEKVYLEFFLLIDQADAEGEVLLVRDLRNKLDGWQASIRILEAKYPDKWARTERQELSGKGGNDFTVKVIYGDKGSNSTPAATP